MMLRHAASCAAAPAQQQQRRLQQQRQAPVRSRPPAPPHPTAGLRVVVAAGSATTSSSSTHQPHGPSSRSAPQAEQPAAGSSTPTHSSTTTAWLAQASQAYLRRYAAPLTAPLLAAYAAPEAAFDRLLTAPNLDARLAGGTDPELSDAAASLKLAVTTALRLAFPAAGDQPAEPPTATAAAAAPQASSPQPEPELPPGGCVALGSDDQCEVDWGSLDEELEAMGGSATSSSSQAAAAALQQETGEPLAVAAARTFLQRILYKINRLAHFWYDDLSNYANERSAFLAALRDTIEGPWQAWELQQLLVAAASDSDDAAASPGSLDGYKALSPEQIKDGLRARYARDVDPPPGPALAYVAREMPPLGYAHLMALGSVDGLVEASRQSRVCAGVANAVSTTIFRVLMEEYGTGRLSHKHSTFYKNGMQDLGLDTREERYLHLLPWQCLAAANANFALTEQRRCYLRYAGALSLFEISGPAVYKAYLAAARRCRLSEAAGAYWALHIREDERHGRQMLDEVALPLVDMYPRAAWELLVGYDQDRFMGMRAGAAMACFLRAADALRRQAGE